MAKCRTDIARNVFLLLWHLLREETMTKNMQKNLKVFLFSCLMAFLLLGGIALAGSEFVDFPYGQLIGVPMLLIFGWIGRKLS